MRAAASAPAKRGWSPDHESLNRRGHRGRLRGHRHRHRHPARQAADHLRGLPAGATAAPAASTAAPAWAWRSAARSPACWAARSGSRARPARAAPSRSTCPLTYRAASRTAAPRGPRRPPTRSRPLSVARRWPPARGRRGRRCPPLGGGASRTTAPPSSPGDRVLLIVEDDPAFARILLDMAPREGLQGRGRDPGRRRPEPGPRAASPTPSPSTCSLPDLDGWRVLDRLKDDPATRHIPVHIISVADEPERALQPGRPRLPDQAGRPRSRWTRPSAR